MSQHTPGPWTVHGPSPGKGAFDDGGDYCIRDAEGKIIGEAIALVGHGDHRPALANATLWAAAPAMLEALKAVLNCGDYCYVPGKPGEAKVTGEFSEVLRKIEYTIAQAERKGE